MPLSDRTCLAQEVTALSLCLFLALFLAMSTVVSADNSDIKEYACKCECPTNTTWKYVDAPQDCTCDYVVQDSEVCLHCYCYYEERNSFLIQAVVYMFIVAFGFIMVVTCVNKIMKTDAFKSTGPTYYSSRGLEERETSSGPATGYLSELWNRFTMRLPYWVRRDVLGTTQLDLMAEGLL
eukprot:Clim_evm8s128 gene=Clim_evmTU8s128